MSRIPLQMGCRPRTFTTIRVSNHLEGLKGTGMTSRERLPVQSHFLGLAKLVATAANVADRSGTSRCLGTVVHVQASRQVSVELILRLDGVPVAESGSSRVVVGNAISAPLSKTICPILSMISS